MKPLVRAVTAVAVAAAIAIVAVRATAGETTRAMVIGLATVIAVAIVVRYRSRADADPTLGRLGSPLAAVWLAITIGPMHSISQRPIGEAVGSPGADAMVEIAAFGLIAAFGFSTLRNMHPDLRSARVPPVVLAYPLLALASASWSTIGTYTFAKGLQLLVLVLISVVTIEFGRCGGDVAGVLSSFLRGFVHVAIVLVAVRTITGPLYGVATGDNVNRYALVGMHPILTAFLVGFALAIVAVAPTQLLGLRKGVRVAYAMVFLVVLYQAHTRAGIAALCAGLAVAVWVRSRESGAFRAQRAPWFVGGAIVLLLPFWDQVYSYVLRGGASDRLTTANGRTDLWRLFLEELETPFDWAFGLGHGQSKILLIDEISWANSAHSSFVAVIVNLGLVGFAAFLWLIWRCAASIRRARRVRGGVGVVFPVLLAMLLAWSYTSDAMIEASGGLAIMYFLFSVTEALVVGSPPPEDSPLGPPVVVESGR